MPHAPAPLVFELFDSQRRLDGLADSNQEQYLRGYLGDLGTQVIVTERNYFDRDYLSEFAAFFGASARAYPNVCRRLHFLADGRVDRALFAKALDGDADARDIIASSYLGFVVVRPIAATPFGRSVLKMYDSDPTRPARCVAPARSYRPHLAGLELSVTGIAWQQQDTSISACATVALWTMFQASAFDEHHAMPTTTEVTKLANEAMLSRGRVFPSEGLNVYQLSRSIRAAGLEPMIADPRGSAEVFASVVASLVRSRFPVLVAGEANDAGHAVCIVGFRESAIAPPAPGHVTPQDQGLEALYVHDDNLGPNVRFEIVPPNPTAAPPTQLAIRTAPPARAQARGSVTTNYPPLVVALAVAAVPEGVRVSVTALELDVNAPPSHREVAHAASPLVVAPPTSMPTGRARGRFFRRRRTMTRAYRSPNTPFSSDAATKPGSENSARIDAGLFIARACPQLGAGINPRADQGNPCGTRVRGLCAPAEAHSDPRRPTFLWADAIASALYSAHH